MKKILNHRLYLPLFIMIVALLSACKKNVETPPVISEVRSYVASPNDTVINGLVVNDQIKDGQWVVISGQNLKNATQIKFDGVTAPFNGALFAQNNAVVRIPGILFSTIDTTKLYTIEYTTTGGTTTFSFKLGPGAPTITAISNVFADPGDSVFLYGTNLVLVESLSYAGTAITSFKSNLYGTSLGFKMPVQQPTDRVLLTTKGGSVDFKIVATPTITCVSNENASAGDSVYVYGTYLKNIQTFTFGGAAVTSFQSSADGSSVGFVMPSISTTGPVSITTPFGSVTTIFNVNTQNGVTEGLLANFEWGDNFGYAWWGDEKLAFGPVADFNGSMGTNNTMYIYFDSPALAGGASLYAPLGNSNTGNHWVPVANLTDPPSHWALQFEMSVAHPWNGGTLYIRTEFAGDTYVARYEPWKIPNSNNTKAFITKGWQTVTIPLTDFRSKVNTLGDGESITQLNQLLGPTGANSYNMTLKNFGTSPTATGFYAAIDNIRCVKIK
jgi:hypothetical protein